MIGLLCFMLVWIGVIAINCLQLSQDSHITCRWLHYSQIVVGLLVIGFLVGVVFTLPSNTP